MFDRTSLRRALRAAALLVFLTAGAAGLSVVAASAAPRDTVNAKLVEMGIAEAQVESIELVAQRNSSTRGGPGRVRGYLAYVRIRDAAGYLVIRLNAGGAYRGAFTTGGYSRPGLPRY